MSVSAPRAESPARTRSSSRSWPTWLLLFSAVYIVTPPVGIFAGTDHRDVSRCNSRSSISASAPRSTTWHAWRVFLYGDRARGGGSRTMLTDIAERFWDLALFWSGRCCSCSCRGTSRSGSSGSFTSSRRRRKGTSRCSTTKRSTGCRTPSRRRPRVQPDARAPRDDRADRSAQRMFQPARVRPACDA